MTHPDAAPLSAEAFIHVMNYSPPVFAAWCQGNDNAARFLATISSLSATVAVLTEVLCPKHPVAPYRVCKLCSHGGLDQPGGWPKHSPTCPLHDPPASALAYAQRLKDAEAEVIELRKKVKHLQCVKP